MRIKYLNLGYVLMNSSMRKVIQHVKHIRMSGVYLNDNKPKNAKTKSPPVTRQLS